MWFCMVGCVLVWFLYGFAEEGSVFVWFFLCGFAEEGRVLVCASVGLLEGGRMY